MKLVYAKEEIDNSQPSIFLAGPTPRSKDVASWRPNAIKMFEVMDFKGSLFIPEARDEFTWDYLTQVEWEEEGLNTASCILFWIPREMETMPGLITNIEWGTWHQSGKVVVRFPLEAERMRYIKYYADKFNIPYSHLLPNTVVHAVDMANKLYG